MVKKNFTLFSIATTIAVLVIAMIILLIGNYTKNLSSGIALTSQILEIKTLIPNDSETDKVWIITSASEFNEIVHQNISKSLFDDYLILGIVSTAKPSAGYNIALDRIALRSTRINTSYRITQPEKDKVYADVITYPNLFLKISKNDLPVGVPLDFAFTNLTDRTTQIINQSLNL